MVKEKNRPPTILRPHAYSRVFCQAQPRTSCVVQWTLEDANAGCGRELNQS